MELQFKNFTMEAKKKDNDGLISGMTFTEEIISNIETEDIVYNKCIFQRMKFNGLSFDNTIFGECEFKSCTFNDCKGLVSFNESKFDDTIFNSCQIPAASFIKAVFANSQFNDTILNNANFTLADISGAEVNQCEVEGTIFEKYEKNQEQIQKRFNRMVSRCLFELFGVFESFGDLLGDEFSEKYLPLKEYITEMLDSQLNSRLMTMSKEELETVLDKHEKKGSALLLNKAKAPDFSDHDFHSFNFQDRNLSGINFSGCDLTDCIFTGCELSYCNFSNADLSNAILYGAHFYQNVFDGAKMNGIILDKKNKEDFMKAGIIPNELPGNLPGSERM